MSVTAAASGFVVLLLTVTVVQGADPWGVTCTPTPICAVKGSKVQIHCSYWHPSRKDGHDVAVEKTFWFTKVQDSKRVDLREASEYTGRVKYDCGNKACTLTITDLRDSDSAVYKFRFTTNHRAGRFTGSTGVSLSVTGVKVISTKSSDCRGAVCSESRVECQTSCPPTPSLSYIWYKNGQKTTGEKSYTAYFESRDSLSCAVRGHEDFPSAPVYAPKPPSVSVSPSGEIMEGSSVTLTCSSDANPAAHYTWYKEDEDSPTASGQIFTITNITAEDGGKYQCEAQNTHGRSKATLHLTVGAVLPAAWISALIGSAAAVFLAVTLLSVFLLIRKKRNSQQSADPGDRLDHSEQCRHNQSEENCDLHASVHFMKSETDPVYSNVGSAEPSEHKEAEEVAYASVNFNRSAPRTRGQDTGEDPAALYGTVQKPPAV